MYSKIGKIFNISKDNIIELNSDKFKKKNYSKCGYNL